MNIRCNTDALNLVTSNKGYLGNVCKKYLDMGYDYKELFQIGFLGMVKAAILFDESKGVKFITFAYMYIRNEIRREITSVRSVIRTPGREYYKIKKVKNAIDELTNKNGINPTIEDISKRIKMPEYCVLRAIQLSSPVISLNSLCNDDSTTELIDSIPSPEDKNYDDLYHAILKLNKREKYVVIQSIVYKKTNDEISKKNDISTTMVIRIKNKRYRNCKSYWEVTTMIRKNGRPKGPEKSKTTIYVTPLMDKAICVLIAFRKGRNYSRAIESAVIELAKQTIIAEGLQTKYPMLMGNKLLP